VQALSELQRQGMSIQAISKLTGWDWAPTTVSHAAMIGLKRGIIEI